jgi:mannose/fructose/N-acetylgalactosamine-specific phosphotransferase system component IID
MCGCICWCLGLILLVIISVAILIGIKFMSYFYEFGFYFVFEKIKYWTIFSVEIFATLVGFIILSQMLYDLAKDILKLKENNVNQKDINIIKQNMNKIMKNIILNLVVLSTFYYLYCRFESEYYKTVMILYTSVILGFTASFPLLKNTYEINYLSERLLMMKTIGNSSMLFVSYLFYNFYLKHKL